MVVVYRGDSWRLECLQSIPLRAGEEWAKILPQKMYKQTLIIIGTTEKANIDVIMVHRQNQGTECDTITRPLMHVMNSYVLVCAHKQTGSVMWPAGSWCKTDLSCLPEMKSPGFFLQNCRILPPYSKSLSSLLINGTALTTARSEWQKREGKLQMNSAKSFLKVPLSLAPPVRVYKWPSRNSWTTGFPFGVCGFRSIFP